MEKKIIITNDGSHSLFVPALNENYHSTHGAWNEAMHVFIEKGLKKINSIGPISILEIGFGTGLNTMLTAKEANELKKDIHYTSIEKYPLSEDIIQQLNFTKHIPDQMDEFGEIYTKIHAVDWGSFQKIHSFFQLQKLEECILDWEPSKKFDLIYFDAFAPEKQPKIWEDEIFQKMYDCLNTNGVLTTYCSKGVIKRRLKSIGFRLVKTPGPPGRREMTVAYKD